MIKYFSFFILLWLSTLGLMSFIVPSRDVGEELRVDPITLVKSEEAAQLVKRIESVLREVNDLRTNYKQIRHMLSPTHEEFIDPPSIPLIPSAQYERTRRLLEIDLKEMWYTVKAKTGNIGEPDMTQIREVYQ